MPAYHENFDFQELLSQRIQWDSIQDCNYTNRLGWSAALKHPASSKHSADSSTAQLSKWILWEPAPMTTDDDSHAWFNAFDLANHFI